eukprot:XP_023973806.1 uncharacterized protein LOC112063131 [Physeter catodon]
MAEEQSELERSLLEQRSPDGDENRSDAAEASQPTGQEASPTHRKLERAQQAIRTGTEHAKAVTRRGYEKSRQFVINQYTRFKQDPKRGPRVLTFVSVVSCFVLIPALAFDIITLALTLSPLDVLADIYAIVGCVLVLLAEYARISSGFGIRSVLHFYFQFIEFTAGRGVAQMYIASLCVSLKDLLNLFKFVPGLFLLLCGVLNVMWGLYAAVKLNSMMAKLKEYDDENFESKTMVQKLDLLDRKFELLDKRGDGLLTIEDLSEGIKEMNLLLTVTELRAVFDALDTDHDGVVTKDDFEAWWLREKGPKFL